MNKTRLEAFSDGVLAIIITIMVLEIKVPHGSDWSELYKLLPVFACYIMSFIYVGIYWGNHHHLLHSIRRVSPAIIWANMNQLFWLSLIPFVTGWMAENHFACNTVALYGIMLLLCGLAFIILQHTAEKHMQDGEQLKKAFVNLNKKGIISLVGYILSIPLAFVFPVISGCIYMAIALLWIVPDTQVEKALEQTSE